MDPGFSSSALMNREIFYPESYKSQNKKGKYKIVQEVDPEARHSSSGILWDSKIDEHTHTTSVRKQRDKSTQHQRLHYTHAALTHSLVLKRLISHRVHSDIKSKKSSLSCTLSVPRPNMFRLPRLLSSFLNCQSKCNCKKSLQNSVITTANSV